MNPKEIVNNIFKVFLNLIPNKKARAKLKAGWTKNYIKKYTKIAVQNYVERHEVQKEDVPPIFQYWEQGIENAPDMIRVCVNSLNRVSGEHIVLNYKTIEDYVEIPSFIYDFKNKGLIKPAQFSDILRSCLLASRPGVWADATLLFTDDFPEYIKQNDFFMFKGIIKTPEQFAGANYFIYSKAPNPLLVQLRDSIIEYWKDNDFLVSYFTHPHYISLLAKENKELWDKIPTVDERLTLQFADILFNKYDEKVYEEIVSKSAIHKLTYKIPHKLKTDLRETYYAKIIDIAKGK